MKKTTLCLLGLLFLFVSFPVQAHYVGLTDHTEEGFKFSALYSHSQGDFEARDTESELELTSQLAAARVDLTLFEKLQFHGLIGTSFIDFADSSPEDGTVYGGGAQYLFEPGNGYYLKLTGSFLEHETQDYDDSDEHFEITTDWQAGIMIGQKLTQQLKWEETETFSTYLGGIYSERKLESGAHQGKYELEDLSGASLVAGVKYTFTDFLLLEGEGQLGAESGVGGRMIYRWK